MAGSEAKERKGGRPKAAVQLAFPYQVRQLGEIVRCASLHRESALGDLSIALIGVAVDIGEGLSVPGSGSVEFSMPLTANVPSTPHRAPADVATGGSRHAATIEVVHTRAASLVDCRMPSG